MDLYVFLRGMKCICNNLFIFQILLGQQVTTRMAPRVQKKQAAVHRVLGQFQFLLRTISARVTSITNRTVRTARGHICIGIQRSPFFMNDKILSQRQAQEDSAVQRRWAAARDRPSGPPFLEAPEVAFLKTFQVGPNLLLS